MEKSIGRKTILKEAGVLLIVSMLTLASLYAFIPTTIAVKAVIYSENTAITASVTFYSTLSDGEVWQSSANYSETWNDIDGIVFDDNKTIRIGQFWVPLMEYQIYRSFFFFNTSSIHDGVTITSAVLSLFGKTDYSYNDFSLIVQNGQPDYPNDPLIGTDYNKDNYGGNGGSLGTMSFTILGYNDIDLDTGIDWINKQGTTKLCLRSSRDINYQSPGFEYVEVYSSEQGGVYRPKLTIEYINEPPNKPEKPVGQTSGYVKTNYNYTTSTTDPEGDQVYYKWDWGDGIQSLWLGPFASGAQATAQKSWYIKGDYIIKVKAKDIHGAESNWSEPLSVTIPRTISIKSLLMKFLERFLNAFPILRNLMDL